MYVHRFFLKALLNVFAVMHKIRQLQKQYHT